MEIRPYPSNVATRMIEDFMLMANETVAEEYCTREIPFLYRTHDKPDGDRMEATLTLIREQGIKVEKRSHEITPGEVQKILTSIEGTPEEPLISRLLLRSFYGELSSGTVGMAEFIPRNAAATSDWQRHITAILPHQSAVTRICRSTALSRMICGDVSTRAAESANIRPFCSMWRSSRVRWSSGRKRGCETEESRIYAGACRRRVRRRHFRRDRLGLLCRAAKYRRGTRSHYDTQRRLLQFR